MSLESIRLLRTRTGATLVHCKLALADARDDLEAAVALIERRGQAVPENLEKPAAVSAALASEPRVVRAEPEPAVPDETELVAAIRRRDVDAARRALEGRTRVSADALAVAVSFAVGVEQIADLSIAGIEGASHRIARALAASAVDGASKAKLIGRLVEATPPGFARAEVLRVALGAFADELLPTIPGVLLAKRGQELGAVVRDVAVRLVRWPRGVIVQEAASEEEAKSVVAGWIGVMPAPVAAPVAFGWKTVSESTKTTGRPLEPRVLAALSTLGLEAGPTTRVTLETPVGPVELSEILSALIQAKWPRRKVTHEDRKIACGKPFLVEDRVVGDYDGPLLCLAVDEASGFSFVIRAHDAAANPMVYRVDDDGEEGLPEGEPLSKFLGDLRC